MNRKWNRLSTLLLCLMFVFSINMAAYAHDVPKLDQPCSLTVVTRDDDTIIKGGTLTIYRVGEVMEDDGNYSFRLTGDFVTCGESVADLSHSADMAERMMKFANQNALTGLATKTIDANGTLTFDGLQAGLYLLVQPTAAAGYEKISPFLVSLPYVENGIYVYDLTANPKTGLPKEAPPTWEPDREDPPESTAPTLPRDVLEISEPSVPLGSVLGDFVEFLDEQVPLGLLPATGQLWWPVPLLACAGLALFTAGLALKRRRRTDER